MKALNGGGELEQAREHALRLLSRPRSEAELRRELARRGYSPAAQEEVLERLRQVGLVDDRAYARAYIQDTLSRRPAGSRWLRYRLQQRGVDPEAIEEALAEREEDEDTAARRAASRWLRGQGKRASRPRLQAYLVGRGFEGELARMVAQALLPDEEDE